MKFKYVMVNPKQMDGLPLYSGPSDTRGNGGREGADGMADNEALKTLCETGSDPFPDLLDYES